MVIFHKAAQNVSFCDVDYLLGIFSFYLPLPSSNCTLTSRHLLSSMDVPLHFFFSQESQTTLKCFAASHKSIGWLMATLFSEYSSQCSILFLPAGVKQPVVKFYHFFPEFFSIGGKENSILIILFVLFATSSLLFQGSQRAAAGPNLAGGNPSRPLQGAGGGVY